MAMPVICYKLHEPIVYNKGTKYEKKHDTFLECYCASRTAAIQKCAQLNETVTDRIYFVDEQEEMF